MKIDQKTYLKLLRCRLYAPYLIFSANGVAINFKDMPKTHYLDLDGDSIDGLIFCQKLNAHKSDIIPLEILLPGGPRE